MIDLVSEDDLISERKCRVSKLNLSKPIIDELLLFAEIAPLEIYYDSPYKLVVEIYAESHVEFLFDIFEYETHVWFGNRITHCCSGPNSSELIKYARLYVTSKFPTQIYYKIKLKRIR